MSRWLSPFEFPIKINILGDVTKHIILCYLFRSNSFGIEVKLKSFPCLQGEKGRSLYFAPFL